MSNQPRVVKVLAALLASMTAGATVLMILGNNPPSAGVLKYVVNLSQNDFEDGIQELILVSLVIPEQIKTKKGEINRHFTLLSLTRGYVRQQLDKDYLLKRDIDERLRTVHATIEEAERAKKEYRFSLSNLGATTEEEKVAAMIAQTAFQKYQTGNYLEAVEDYKKACDIAPRFSALYRNWAVMESQEGHSIEADKLMEKASKLNPNDPQIWLTWGNMKRKADKVKEALRYYEKAYELAPEDYVILNSMGQAKCRLGDYIEADKLFRDAYQKESTGSSIRHEIINRSSIADNLKRWAESLIRDRNYKEAEKKLLEALHHSECVVELDKNDVKSQELLREVLINLGFFYKKSNPTKAIKYFSRAIVDNPRYYREAKHTIVASLQIGKILYNSGRYEEAKKYITYKLFRMKGPLSQDPKLRSDLNFYIGELYIKQNLFDGKIIKVNPYKGFVIIELILEMKKTMRKPVPLSILFPPSPL